MSITQLSINIIQYTGDKLYNEHGFIGFIVKTVFIFFKTRFTRRFQRCCVAADGAADGEHSGRAVRAGDAGHQHTHALQQSPGRREAARRRRQADAGPVEVELPGNEGQDRGSRL